jgi:Beta-propeller repeat
MRVQVPGRLGLIAGLLLAAVSALLVSGGARAHGLGPRLEAAEYFGLPLHFEPNLGQSPNYVRFIARTGSYAVLIDASGATIVLPDRTHDDAASPVESLMPQVRARPSGSPPGLVRIDFVGANRKMLFEPSDRMAARVNYFVGNDPKRWRTDVPIYGKLRARGVWPGIDLVYHADGSQLELDFAIAPGADPNRIRLDIGGADNARLDSRGNLVLEAGADKFSLIRPRVFQMAKGRRREIGSRYVLSPVTRPRAGRPHASGRVDVRIELATFDRHKPLVIDPGLSYSTFFGGSGNDRGLAVATDGKGNVYVAGSTTSLDLPRRDAADPSCSACTAHRREGFVAKFNPKRFGAASLVYATYMGGTGNSINRAGDLAAGVAVDSNGNIYVTGTTTSADFPTTSNAFMSACPTSPVVSPCNTAFVTELNPSASGIAQLVYSTYLGGSGNADLTPPLGDAGVAITVPSPGQVYLTGSTSSIDFPLTQNPFQDDCGSADFDSSGIFLAQLDTRQSGPDSLMYSTYLCGSTTDFPKAISVVAPIGVILVAGGTFSDDFEPVNSSFFPPFQDSCNACTSAPNAFVVELSPLQPPDSQVVYASFFGGSGSTLANGDSTGDFATGVSADRGIISLAGLTSSPDLLDQSDVTPNAFQQKCPSVNLALRDGTPVCSSGFVAQMAPGPDTALLLYGSYLGGSGNRTTRTGDLVTGMAADAFGDIYVTGMATSPNFPVTGNAFRTSCGSCSANAFLAKIDPSISGRRSLVFSTLLGGSVSDRANAIALDNAGNAAIAGVANSGDFPTTGNAFSTGSAGGSDAFLSVVAMAPSVFAPRHINFGALAVFGPNRESKTRAVVLRAPAGDLPVKFGPFKFSPPPAGSYFTLRSGGNGCFNGLRPAHHCPILIAFTPKTQARQTNSLTIPDNTRKGSTVVSLVGSGLGTVSIIPGALSFGARRVGTESRRGRVVTIINRHDIPMGISSIAPITPTGDASPDFSVSDNECTAGAGTGLRLGVAAHSPCEITVKFKPMAKGRRSAFLTIDDQAPDSPQKIRLTGVGK